MKSKMRSSAHVDLCRGPLYWQIAVFSFPLMVSGVLQICFNAADMIVVGRFGSATSLAAVGASSSLCHLLVAVFMGLSIGANVVVAHFTGAKDAVGASGATHTTIALALWSGLLMVGCSCFLVEPLLRWMCVPDGVLSLAVLYTLVYCIGIPFYLLYNFGAAILRAVGDTRRPTVYLLWSGVVNVVLNLVFVIGFRMDVLGVALATVLSQALATGLVLRALVKEPEDGAGIGLRWRKLGMHRPILRSVVRIGLPAGLQGSFFSGSNMLILSAIASLGDMALAGNAAGNNLEGFIYAAATSLQQASVSFVGQNYGGHQVERVRQTVRGVTVGTLVMVSVLGWVMLWVAPYLLRLYVTDAEAIEFGMIRFRVMMPLYALCPLMDVLSGCLRGLGKSFQPAITCFLGACVLRVLWVLVVFPQWPTMGNVMLSYPVSWALVCAVNALYLRRAMRKMLPRE